MDWKAHFTNDIAENFRLDTEDLEAAIENYVHQLTDQELLQLTRKMDGEELRDLLAHAIMEKAEKNTL
ncbi:hypothetical protein GKZ89_13695 [Bacillus mangrovi]|uniref:Uncharacterized protein n=1 Tax=Metabacillus mangrovi TaxID=1491830 RepID=A0A7X2S6D0_9BACI|nr:hypothetical protein [Metabacillus mangrovi]MTH54452.1 hypothetical protein [Metabacillus mangrovi]